jgi:hypothetical protein
MRLIVCAKIRAVNIIIIIYVIYTKTRNVGFPEYSNFKMSGLICALMIKLSSLFRASIRFKLMYTLIFCLRSCKAHWM